MTGTSPSPLKRLLLWRLPFNWRAPFSGIVVLMRMLILWPLSSPGDSRWEKHALKILHHTILKQNVSLELKYVPSAYNPADGLSRILSNRDCMLASAS